MNKLTNMKNSYIATGVIVLVAVLGFILAGKKTEAPIQVSENNTENEKPVALVDGSYRLDVSSSVIYWEGEKLIGSKEKGVIKLQSGEFTVVNSLINSGRFVIDMNTIDSSPHVDRLVEHLKSEDFFAVNSHPTATFVLKKMIPSSEEGIKMGRYVLAGDLTVKDITLPVSFTVNIKADDKNNLSSTASFAINRADWNIRFGSPTFFKNLGDNTIRDAVIIGLDLKAERVIQ